MLVSAQAQDNTDTIMPDVIGQTLPQAIVTLNEAGLLVGTIEQDVWFDGAVSLVNTVSSQSPIPLESRPASGRVDLVIWREPNVTFIYNNEQFNIRSDDEETEFLHFANLRFQASDDPNQSFAETDDTWNFNGVRDVAEGFCVQIWATDFEDFIEIDPCDSIREAISVTDDTHHFWIGRDSFEIYQDDLLLGTCEQTTADDLQTCHFAITSSETAITTDSTPYALFRYDAEQLYIQNRSSDQLLPFLRLDLQIDIDLADIVYDFSLLPELQAFLAPGQCLWLHLEGAAPITDTNCTVVASAEIPERQAFWLNGFELRPQQARQQRQACPAPIDERRMLCLVPR